MAGSGQGLAGCLMHINWSKRTKTSVAGLTEIETGEPNRSNVCLGVEFTGRQGKMPCAEAHQHTTPRHVPVSVSRTLKRTRRSGRRRTKSRRERSRGEVTIEESSPSVFCFIGRPTNRPSHMAVIRSTDGFSRVDRDRSVRLLGWTRWGWAATAAFDRQFRFGDERRPFLCLVLGVLVSPRLNLPAPHHRSHRPITRIDRFLCTGVDRSRDDGGRTANHSAAAAADR